MSAFDNIIGYSDIKEQMYKICDIVKNREVYQSLGASFPHGIMLVGEPGLGKSLMADCFIKECGVDAFVIKSNREDSELILEICEAFSKAKERTPSIILFDDMDKLANDDEKHRDSKAFTTIQAEMDNAKNYDIVVVATVNNEKKLPDSLRRKGRFDYTFEFQMPTDEDNRKLIKYFLSNKKVDKSLDYDDLCKMMSFSSCAELESLINRAAVNAAFARRGSVEMQDILSCVLYDKYKSNCTASDDNAETSRRVAIHEAGHLVMSEILLDGSVGLASARYSKNDSIGGFVSRWKKSEKSSDIILISLAGKAATEMYYLDEVAEGCYGDIENALDEIQSLIVQDGSCGLSFVHDYSSILESPLHKDRIRTVINAELEKYMMKTRNILIHNREFLERVARELEENDALLASDIQRIKNEVSIVRLN